MLVIYLLTSCASRQEEKSSTVTITGKVINYDSHENKSIVNVIVNDNGIANQVSYPAKIDSEGYFKVKLERRYAQDVMISYRTNFRILINPGDSLYVEFDGKLSDRLKIFETVKFNGSGAKVNQQFSQYLKHSFETEEDPGFVNQQIKDLNLLEYISFHDSLKVSRQHSIEDYLEKNPTTSPQVRQWIKSSLKVSMFMSLINYPRLHKRFNELDDSWQVDSHYKEAVLNYEPITKQDLIYSDTRWLINSFLYTYIWSRAWQVSDSTAKANPDSLIFNSIIAWSPEKGLLKQLTANEFVHTTLARYDSSFYKDNINSIESIIKEDFLLEPIHERYERVTTPVSKSDLSQVDAIGEASGKKIWSEILEKNKGKIIFIDSWATWCPPCIAEFRFSNGIMESYKEDDIAFVYLCLRSKRNSWEKIIEERKLGGQHYFLDDEQAAFFEQLLEITGFPSYTLLDKEAKVFRSGNSLRLSSKTTQEIINQLLNK